MRFDAYQCSGKVSLVTFDRKVTTTEAADSDCTCPIESCILWLSAALPRIGAHSLLRLCCSLVDPEPLPRLPVTQRPIEGRYGLLRDRSPALAANPLGVGASLLPAVKAPSASPYLPIHIKDPIRYFTDILYLSAPYLLDAWTSSSFRSFGCQNRPPSTRCT